MGVVEAKSVHDPSPLTCFLKKYYSPISIKSSNSNLACLCLLGLISSVYSYSCSSAKVLILQHVEALVIAFF